MSEIEKHEGTAVAATGEHGSVPIYDGTQGYRWSHLRTLITVVAVLSNYFAQMTVVIGAGEFSSTIAAVVGGSDLASWGLVSISIMPAVLGTPFSQATDYWGRKSFLVTGAAFGMIGCAIVGTSHSMGMVIAGFTLTGFSAATSPLIHAVTSEVLPRRYRSWAQAGVTVSIGLGSIFTLVVGGYLTRTNPKGFRTFYYISSGIYGFATISTFLFYNPAPRELQIQLTTLEKLTSLDWIGIFFLTSGLTLFCVGLSYVQNPYPWASGHVLGPFLVGCTLIVCLVIYSWKFKKDGLLHHALFRRRNFGLALFCLCAEGMAFASADLYYPNLLAVLHGSTMSQFRQALAYNTAWIAFGCCAVILGFWIYMTKAVRLPAMSAFICFIIFYILMATVEINTSEAQFWGYIVFYGAGLACALVTIITLAQLSTPPELIATTSGLLITARSVGSTLGVVINLAITSSALVKNTISDVTAAVKPLGFPADGIAPLITDLNSGNIAGAMKAPGVTEEIIGAASRAIQHARVSSLRWAFVFSGSFSVMALIACFFFENPRSEFNNLIDAPIDGIFRPTKGGDEDKAVPQEEHAENNVALVST